MHTALRAASKTLQDRLLTSLKADSELGTLFGGTGAATMGVYLLTPKAMSDLPAKGLSLWLYRIVRDGDRWNDPPERIDSHHVKRPPLPLRLHYLATPIIASETEAEVETGLDMLGKVLQTFNDHTILRGTDLKDDFVGTQAELHVRLEQLSVEEITRIWTALEDPYVLSVSYEVSLVNISSTVEPESVSPVEVVITEHGVIAAAARS